MMFIALTVLFSVLSDLSINIYAFKLCRGLVEYYRVVVGCMVLMEISM